MNTNNSQINFILNLGDNPKYEITNLTTDLDRDKSSSQTDKDKDHLVGSHDTFYSKSNPDMNNGSFRSEYIENPYLLFCSLGLSDKKSESKEETADSSSFSLPTIYNLLYNNQSTRNFPKSHQSQKPSITIMNNNSKFNTHADAASNNQYTNPSSIMVGMSLQEFLNMVAPGFKVFLVNQESEDTTVKESLADETHQSNPITTDECKDVEETDSNDVPSSEATSDINPDNEAIDEETISGIENRVMAKTMEFVKGPLTDQFINYVDYLLDDGLRRIERQAQESLIERIVSQCKTSVENFMTESILNGLIDNATEALEDKIISKIKPDLFDYVFFKLGDMLTKQVLQIAPLEIEKIVENYLEEREQKRQNKSLGYNPDYRCDPVSDSQEWNSKTYPEEYASEDCQEEVENDGINYGLVTNGISEGFTTNEEEESESMEETPNSIEEEGTEFPNRNEEDHSDLKNSLDSIGEDEYEVLSNNEIDSEPVDELVPEDIVSFEEYFEQELSTPQCDYPDSFIKEEEDQYPTNYDYKEEALYESDTVEDDENEFPTFDEMDEDFLEEPHWRDEEPMDVSDTFDEDEYDDYIYQQLNEYGRDLNADLYPDFPDEESESIWEGTLTEEEELFNDEELLARLEAFHKAKETTNAPEEQQICSEDENQSSCEESIIGIRFVEPITGQLVDPNSTSVYPLVNESEGEEEESLSAEESEDVDINITEEYVEENISDIEESIDEIPTTEEPEEEVPAAEEMESEAVISPLEDKEEFLSIEEQEDEDISLSEQYDEDALTTEQSEDEDLSLLEQHNEDTLSTKDNNEEILNTQEDEEYEVKVLTTEEPENGDDTIADNKNEGPITERLQNEDVVISDPQEEDVSLMEEPKDTANTNESEEKDNILTEENNPEETSPSADKKENKDSKKGKSVRKPKSVAESFFAIVTEAIDLIQRCPNVDNRLHILEDIAYFYFETEEDRKIFKDLVLRSFDYKKDGVIGKRPKDENKSLAFSEKIDRETLIVKKDRKPASKSTSAKETKSKTTTTKRKPGRPPKDKTKVTKTSKG